MICLQAGVVGMLINRLVHESMEEECEQFKQAILQVRGCWEHGETVSGIQFTRIIL